jgi:aryl-alcohol dehydrogenase-like predicted oxidoreductase
MPTREFGTSGLKTSVTGFGGWLMGKGSTARSMTSRPSPRRALHMT